MRCPPPPPPRDFGLTFSFVSVSLALTILLISCRRHGNDCLLKDASEDCWNRFSTFTRYFSSFWQSALNLFSLLRGYVIVSKRGGWKTVKGDREWSNTPRERVSKLFNGKRRFWLFVFKAQWTDISASAWKQFFNHVFTACFEIKVILKQEVNK